MNKELIEKWKIIRDANWLKLNRKKRIIFIWYLSMIGEYLNNNKKETFRNFYKENEVKEVLIDNVIYKEQKVNVENILIENIKKIPDIYKIHTWSDEKISKLKIKKDEKITTLLEIEEMWGVEDIKRKQRLETWKYWSSLLTTIIKGNKNEKNCNKCAQDLEEEYMIDYWNIENKEDRKEPLESEWCNFDWSNDKKKELIRQTIERQTFEIERSTVLDLIINLKLNSRKELIIDNYNITLYETNGLLPNTNRITKILNENNLLYRELWVRFKNSIIFEEGEAKGINWLEIINFANDQNIEINVNYVISNNINSKGEIEETEYLLETKDIQKWFFNNQDKSKLSFVYGKEYRPNRSSLYIDNCEIIYIKDLQRQNLKLEEEEEDKSQELKEIMKWVMVPIKEGKEYEQDDNDNDNDDQDDNDDKDDNDDDNDNDNDDNNDNDDDNDDDDYDDNNNLIEVYDDDKDEDDNDNKLDDRDDRDDRKKYKGINKRVYIDAQEYIERWKNSIYEAEDKGINKEEPFTKINLKKVSIISEYIKNENVENEILFDPDDKLKIRKKYFNENIIELNEKGQEEIVGINQNPHRVDHVKTKIVGNINMTWLKPSLEEAFFKWDNEDYWIEMSGSGIETNWKKDCEPFRSEIETKRHLKAHWERKKIETSLESVNKYSEIVILPFNPKVTLNEKKRMAEVKERRSKELYKLHWLQKLKNTQTLKLKVVNSLQLKKGIWQWIDPKVTLNRSTEETKKMIDYLWKKNINWLGPEIEYIDKRKQTTLRLTLHYIKKILSIKTWITEGPREKLDKLVEKVYGYKDWHGGLESSFSIIKDDQSNLSDVSEVEKKRMGPIEIETEHPEMPKFWEEVPWKEGELNPLNKWIILDRKTKIDRMNNISKLNNNKKWIEKIQKQADTRWKLDKWKEKDKSKTN